MTISIAHNRTIVAVNSLFYSVLLYSHSFPKNYSNNFPSLIGSTNLLQTSLTSNDIWTKHLSQTIYLLFHSRIPNKPTQPLSSTTEETPQNSFGRPMNPCNAQNIAQRDTRNVAKWPNSISRRQVSRSLCRTSAVSVGRVPHASSRRVNEKKKWGNESVGRADTKWKTWKRR